MARAFCFSVHGILICVQQPLVAQDTKCALRLIQERNLSREACNEAETRLAVVHGSKLAQLHVRHEGGPPLVVIRIPGCMQIGEIFSNTPT